MEAIAATAITGVDGGKIESEAVSLSDARRAGYLLTVGEQTQPVFLLIDRAF
jgi:hypothetical protein